MSPLTGNGVTASKRERLPDILKGFGTILVVFGHCIQAGSGTVFIAESLYFSDKLYQFIYSFHMPLFMMVSGYLCWGSVQRAAAAGQRSALLKRRIRALLAPIFLCTAAELSVKSAINLACGNLPKKTIVYEYVWTALNSFWFLWAVFWCFLIVFIVHFYFHDSIALYLSGFLTMFFIPDGLSLGAYKYMLPYFVISFYAHKYMDKRKIDFADMRPQTVWILLSGLTFGWIFLFFDTDSFIYLSGYKLIGKDAARQLEIDFYRFVAGLAGSAFFILLWRHLEAKYRTWHGFALLGALGRDSSGIYILSTYLLLYVIPSFESINRPSYLLNIAQAAVVLAAALLLSELLGRLPFVRKFVGK